MNLINIIAAVGCPKFTKPVGTWTKEDTDLITIGCKENSRTWKMRCIGNNWIGIVGNCSKGFYLLLLSYWFHIDI